jgi:hypothetical protein
MTEERLVGGWFYWEIPGKHPNVKWRNSLFPTKVAGPNAAAPAHWPKYIGEFFCSFLGFGGSSNWPIPLIARAVQLLVLSRVRGRT